MRRSSLALLLAVSVLALPARGQDATEWERPFTGYLPDPEAGPRDSWADVIPRAYGCYVVDDDTGAPVAGARVAYHAEVIDGSTVDPSPLLGETLTDHDGHAWLPASDRPGGSHWLISAPGYAPVHSFTFAPPPTVRLERGEGIEGRLLDALGRALVGVRVDWFLGCTHAPVARSTTTRAGGRFTLPDVGSRDGALWVVSAAGQYVYGEPVFAGGLGTRPQDVVVRSGWTARGAVRDAVRAGGQPVSGAVVRYAGFPRGPVTTTAADGSFELHGLPVDAGLTIVANGTQRRFADWRDRTPFEVQWESGESSDEAKLRISLTPPQPAVEVRVTDLRTGHAWLADTDEERPGEAWLELPAGDYEIAPASPLEDAGFRPRRVRLASAPQSIDIETRRHPRLAVDGELPPLADVVLVVPRGEIECDDPAAPWAPPVPAKGPAVLRVRPDPAVPLTWFFPVAPVQDGVRRVRVRLPQPHRIRLASGAPIDFADLRWRGAEPTSRVEDGVVETFATGRMQIDIDSPEWEGTRRFDIELPQRATEISLRRADATVVPDEPDTDDDDDEARAAGPCSLRLVCVDGEGEPLACAVALAGDVHWTDEGVLELTGLPGGPLHVIASPRDPDYEGRELRLVLDESGDGRRERRVRFPERD